MAVIEIHPFNSSHLDEAAVLLAHRHAAQRKVEPALPAAFEDAATARTAIQELLTDEASGAIAIRGDDLLGYVLGTPRADPTWGPNMWVELAGHAVSDPELIRDLYAFAATRWVGEGRTSHYAIVPATDAPSVDAWFRLGFGHQHVHALRQVPTGVSRTPPPGVTTRPAERSDIDALAELDPLLQIHQALSPCFSTSVEIPTVEQARGEWVEEFDDGDGGTFVAERDGRVVGAALVCSVERSGAHSGLARPANAALLAFAVVALEAQGSGIGQALADEALGWARDRGCEVIVTDWRMTNLLSSRAWPRAGYRPTFFRLFRSIA